MRFYFPVLLFCLVPACQGCPVRDRIQLMINEDVHRRVVAAEKEQHDIYYVSPEKAQRDNEEAIRRMHESTEPRFIDRSGYKASPDDTCDPATEDRPIVRGFRSIDGPHGAVHIFPSDVEARLEIPPRALDHNVEITLIMYESQEADHPFDYAILPIGIDLKKPVKLIVMGTEDGPVEHRFMPTGHGEYRDTSSLYEPIGHREVIILNHL